MTGCTIEARQLRKTFGREEVLRGIDLQISPGQVVGLIGANGSGKTTFIKCLLGLLRATSGGSHIFGEDSWNLTAQAKSRLGYVSQDFAMLPWMKVQAICDYTGAFYEHWDNQFVSQLLQEWKLPLDKRVGALSVGQRQKVAAILALGHHPELLILDEPVASLDPAARRQFLQSLIDFTTDDRHTVLFSTHITTDLERIASHVVMLSDGELKHFGELDALKEGCKRLRFSADHPLPNNFEIPGAMRSEVSGSHALVTVADCGPELVAFLSQRWQARVDVEDLNLEEIFLELSGFSTSAMSEIKAMR